MPAPVVPSMTSEHRRRLASQYNLEPMGVRPPLLAYIRDVLSRWSFIRVLATSSAYARNQDSYLGQVWAVLTPLLNATVYVAIFGLLLKANRGVENTIAFIVIGVFTYRFIEQSVSSGAKSISGKSSLIRSLHFPRAALPISTVLSLLTTLVPTLAVMCMIVLLSGLLPAYPVAHITWWWLLMPVAIALLWIFNMGLAFFVARIVAITPDIDKLIGFVMRFVMYGSGVIFPISRYAEDLHDSIYWWLSPILEYQPVAVFLYLVRSCLTQEPSITPDLTKWLWGIGWALVVFAVGLVFFWRGEERYGRD